jgi:AraC-like DNA-binding protein
VNSEIKTFLKLAEESLQVEFQYAAVSSIRQPHGTGWRRVPALCNAQIVSGRIRLQVEGLPTFNLRDRELFALPSNIHHCADLVSSGQSWSRWSHLNFSIAGSIDVFALMRAPYVIRKPLAEKLGDINEEMGELIADKTTTLQHVFRRKALGFQFLALLAGEATMQSGSLELMGCAQRIAPALEYIHAHLGEDLSRDTLAEVIHLSGSRFQTIFRETIGMPPRDYILRQRMRKAQHLLISSDLAIKNIARQVGHGDAFHFSRAFKKAIGVSPAAYRKNSTFRSM